MAKQGTEHVYGPYDRGTKAGDKRWRLVFVDASGKQSAKGFATEGECRAAIKALRKEIEGRSVGDAVQEFLTWHALRVKPSTFATDSFRLMAILRLRESEWGDRALSTIIQDAPELYRLRVAEVKADTHRNELALMSRACEWWAKAPRKWIPRNPCHDIEPEGRRRTRRGEQPRLDEARAYYETLLSDSTPKATAVATALLMGLRATEVVTRTVRDLDDHGRMLWIPDAKTDAGVGALEIPEVLRGRLRQLAEGRGASELLFGDVDRHWLYRAVAAFAREAGIATKITPHTLRRLHSTAAARAGATGEMVARALGHTSVRVTQGSYFAPGTTRQVEIERVTRLLTDGPTRVCDDTSDAVTTSGDDVTAREST